MAELKPCEYCGHKPEMQKGVNFNGLFSMTDYVLYRFNCSRCNIQSKSAYTIEGAIELWNRGTEDGK
jgi:hypothetical protein